MSRLIERLRHWGRVQGDKAACIIDDKMITYKDLCLYLDRPFSSDGWVQESSFFDQCVTWLSALERGLQPVIGHRTLEAEQESLLRQIKGANLYPQADFGVLTSGTTGLPKILWRREETWVDFFDQQNAIFAIKTSSRLFQQGSLSFTGNLNMLLGVLWAGATLVTSDKVSVKQWLHLCRYHKVSHIYSLPTKMQLMVRYSREPIGSVTMIIGGSQTPNQVLITKMKSVFPHMEYILYYGASELNYISYSTYDALLKRPNSIGRAFPGVHVSVRDGFLYVDTPYAVEGVQGPFSLGDRGHIEGDEIFFDGRRTDIINRGGFKIDVCAMEQKVLTLPEVEEVALIGVDDEFRGQEPILFVVGPDSCKAQIYALFHPEERPKAIYCLSEMPLTDCSKIDKRALEKWYNERNK